MAMSCGGSADTPTAVACAKASLKLLEVLPGLTMDELFRRGFEGIDGADIHSACRSTRFHIAQLSALNICPGRETKSSDGACFLWSAC